MENLKIGILSIEGNYENSDKISDFLNNSSNKILKCNDEVIFFKDKKRCQIGTIQDDSLCSANDSDSSFLEENCDFSNQKFKILTNFLKDFEKELHKIKINNIKLFGATRSKFKSKIFDNIPEYYLLEKKKILCLYKIYDSFSEYKIDNNSILSKTTGSLDQTLKNTKQIDFSILKSENPFLQKIIIEIILLRILCIFNNDLAYQVLKYILNFNDERIEDENLCSSLKLILEIEVIYLLGLFLHLSSHYNEISRHKNPQECKELEMNELFINVNKLSQKYVENIKLFSKNELELTSLITRKNFINLNLINFYSKELNNINKIMSITQHVYDYIISKSIERDLSKVSFNSYKFFLEIRNFFFEFINKSDDLENKGMIFNSISDKEYFKYKLKKLNYDIHFKDSKNKQYNLSYKGKGVKYNHEEKNLETKKINLPIIKDKKIKIIYHRHYNSSIIAKFPLSLDPCQNDESEKLKLLKNDILLSQTNRKSFSPDLSQLSLLKQKEPKTNDNQIHIKFNIQSSFRKSDTIRKFQLELKKCRSKNNNSDKFDTCPNSPLIYRRKFIREDILLPSFIESQNSNSIVTNIEEEADRYLIQPIKSKINIQARSVKNFIIKKNNFMKNFEFKTIEKENSLIIDSLPLVLPLKSCREVD